MSVSERATPDQAPAGQVSCVVVHADGSPCPGTVRVGRYCDDHEPVLLRDLEILKLVHEHFRQDLREFWRRSNLYLVVNAALVSVYATGEQTPLRYGLAAFGLVTSLFWLLVTRGSVVWLRRWRAELKGLAALVDRVGVFHRTEGRVETRLWQSPSWVTQWLPLVFLLGWILMLVATR